jgi:hypothetical protein
MADAVMSVQLSVSIECMKGPTVLKPHDYQNDDRYRKCLVSPNTVSVDQIGQNVINTYHI